MDGYTQRYGTTTEHENFVGQPNEITVDNETKSTVVHDGVTPGGHRQASEAYVDERVAEVGGSTYTHIYTATGGETTITVPAYTTGANQLLVTIEGNVQFLGTEYTETTSTSITLAQAMTAGEKILVQKV